MDSLVTMMCALHRHYTEEPAEPESVRRMLARWLAADGRLGGITICLKQETAIGFASTTFAVPGPDFKPVMILKDLFVVEPARNAGAGEYIMRFLAKTCLANDISRLDLSTESWNGGAMGFYERLGGRFLEQKRFFRFTGPNLEQLAQVGRRQ